MSDFSKLEHLNMKIEKYEKQLHKAENDEKALRHKRMQLTRSERTHRLCTRGGMLESFLQEPGQLTDDDVMELLAFIFHGEDVQKKMKMMIEKRKEKQKADMDGF